MDIRDLQEAYLEYKLGRFTANDLAEYRELFYQLTIEYDWDPDDIWGIAYFEITYPLNDVIPYDKVTYEWESPITGIKYKPVCMAYPEEAYDRVDNCILIDNEWRVL